MNICDIWGKKMGDDTQLMILYSTTESEQVMALYKCSSPQTAVLSKLVKLQCGDKFHTVKKKEKKC